MSELRRILHITQYLRYGSATGIMNWIRLQRLLGHPVEVLLSQPVGQHQHDPGNLRALFAIGVRIHYVDSTFFRMPYQAQAVLQKVQHLLHGDPVLHTHGGFAAMVLGKAGLGFVHTVHGLGMNRPQWVDMQDREGLLSARAVSGISEDAICQARQLARKELNTMLTPYWIDLSAKAPADLEKGRRVVLGQVGDMVPLKGHKYSIQALKILVDQGYNLCLRLVGDGLLRPELLRLVEELGMADRVEFTGYLPRQKVYSGIDILLVPSLKEGLGLVCAEALSAGIPVVAFATGGIPEVCGSSGARFCRVDAQDLARGVVSYIRDWESAKKHVRWGVLHIQERFSQVRAAAALSALYERLK